VSPRCAETRPGVAYGANMAAARPADHFFKPPSLNHDQASAM
jgi:hypothetical protein